MPSRERGAPLMVAVTLSLNVALMDRRLSSSVVLSKIFLMRWIDHSDNEGSLAPVVWGVLITKW